MKEILITGGTGTVGNILAEHFGKQDDVRRIIIYSRDEYKQAKMREKHIANKKMRYFIGDIRDRERLSLAMRGATHVIHAAAMKRIEACTTNPIEAIKTNIDGTNNVIMAAIENDVQRATLISTDKSVNPTTIYGKTKAVAEDSWIYANVYKKRFNAVRMGNIIGSTGSFVEKLINMPESEEAELTDERCTRFIAGKKHLIAMVEKCFADVGIYVRIPKMDSCYISDLIAAFKRNFKIIGLRDREKIREEIFNDEERERLWEEEDCYVISLHKNIKPWVGGNNSDNYLIGQKDVYREIGRLISWKQSGHLFV